jgi:hypothetical protein
VHSRSQVNLIESALHAHREFQQAEITFALSGYSALGNDTNEVARSHSTGGSYLQHWADDASANAHRRHGSRGSHYELDNSMRSIQRIPRGMHLALLSPSAWPFVVMNEPLSSAEVLGRLPFMWSERSKVDVDSFALEVAT